MMVNLFAVAHSDQKPTNFELNHNVMCAMTLPEIIFGGNMPCINLEFDQLQQMINHVRDCR